MNNNNPPDERAYKDKLKDFKWIRARAFILKRDDYTCQHCGMKYDWGATLQVHHLSYHGENPWDSPPSALITLCRRCHEKAHDIPAVDPYEKRHGIKTRISEVIDEYL
jgi:5-methylcytosine-specific restriction endonuclease McrA